MNGLTIHQLFIGASAESENQISLENAHRYAEITQDYNPLHFETDEARQSRYGRPIAHGMILAGFVSGVIGSQLPGYGCIYASQNMKFLRPVFYNEKITTRVTVTGIDPDRNRVVLSTDCFNEQGEAVMSGEAVVLPRKDT